MTPEEALTAGFQTWLESAVSAESRPVASRTVHPFASSMRYPWQIVEGMRHAAEGEITTDDPSQRFGDLQRAGLVDGSHAVTGLTQLGESVVNEWKRHGLFDQTGNAENIAFARSVVLVDAAWKQQSARYIEMLNWWRARRRERRPEEWYDDRWALVAAAYLTVQHNGYTPHDVMLAAGVPYWNHREELDAWAETMSVPTGWGKSRLAVVLHRIGSNASRAGGTVPFMQALEAVTLRNEGVTGTSLRAQMTDWGL